MTLHLIIKENTESKTEELVSPQEIIFVIFKQREWLWNFSHDHCKTNTITNGKLRSSYRDRERGWQHRTTFTLLTYYFQCSRLPHDKSVYAKWLIRAGVYPGFCGFFYTPLDGMQSIAGLPPAFRRTHLYTWVERGTVREHNIMFPARTWARTTRSGVKHTNHEATAPPPWYQLSTVRVT